MPKFKNKKTGVIVEEHLQFYVEKMRSNPSFKEIKQTTSKKEKNEVEDEPLQ